MQHFPGIFPARPNIYINQVEHVVTGMTDRDAKIDGIRTLMRLLADIEKEIETTGLSGEAFLAEMRELRQQCELELTLLERRKEESHTDEG